MRVAYERLVEGQWLDTTELVRLEAWLSDIENITSANAAGKQALVALGEAPITQRPTSL
jgi:hypothetical protein